jgi:hypothetical protein
MRQNTHDQDKSKGATEDDNSKQPGNPGLQGQLGHRDPNAIIKDADSDFPEPGASPEHTGEPEENTSVTKRRIPA